MIKRAGTEGNMMLAGRIQSSTSLWVQGGLGNQLFQLNAALNLASQHSTRLLISQSSFGRDKLRDFELARLVDPHDLLSAAEELLVGQPYDWRGRKKSHSLMRHVAYVFASERPQDADFAPGSLNVGFYQEPEWLAFSTSPVCERLQAEATRTIDAVQPGQFVVHVRRGDYASSPSARATFGYLDHEYYREAASRLGRDLSEALFFTDDPDAVQQEFRVERSQIVGPDDIHSPLDTLLTMARAEALVIPNSTFSWWAAELAGSVPVAAPRTWFFDRPGTLRREHWIGVPNS